jgi:hypothetical protein
VAAIRPAGSPGIVWRPVLVVTPAQLGATVALDAIAAPDGATAAPMEAPDQLRRCDERGDEGDDETRNEEPIRAAAGRRQQAKHDEREEIRRERRSPESCQVEAPGRDGGDGDEPERDGQEPGGKDHAADHTAAGAAPRARRFGFVARTAATCAAPRCGDRRGGASPERLAQPGPGVPPARASAATLRAVRDARYDCRVTTDDMTGTGRRMPGALAAPARRPPSSVAWRETDPAALSPVVLVVGGFLTMPGWYGGLARELRRRGAADVLVAPVYLADWVLAAARGLGPITTRVGRALLEAGARSAASPQAQGAPVLYVGHSAGGLIGRLLTSPIPFEGRTLRAATRIGALVTLGTPNATTLAERGGGRWGRRVGEAGARFAERHVPGATFAPTTAYVSVASTLLVGRRETADARERFVHRLYEDVYPQPDLDAVAGDGLIPVAAALLPGSRQVVLANATHGPGRRLAWYGTDASIDAWWPVALDAWRDALRARCGSGASGDGWPARPGAPR